MKVSTVVLLGASLLASTLPTSSGQAFASAGNGALAVAGLPFVFPITVPCDTFYNVSPWAPPSSIPTPTPGLLSIVNGTPQYSVVTLCCGGTITFQWTGNHSVVQLATGACPTAATPATAQRTLVVPTVNGSASLFIPDPGTFWLASTVDSDCTLGQILQVNVPNNFNCPAAIPSPPPPPPPPPPPVTAPAPAVKPKSVPVSPSPSPSPSPAPAAASGPKAGAIGPPGGTSTSTSQNAAAAASGPPGSAKTATGNGTAISAAGPGGGALLGGLGADPPTGNIAASLNPPGPNCTEQVVEPNGKGGGAISQGACSPAPATSVAPAGDVSAAGPGGQAATAPGESFSTTPGGRKLSMLRGANDDDDDDD